MANLYQNPNMFTSETLASLINALVFSKHVSRDYEKQFGKAAKIGDTYNIRRPARFTVSSGAALSTQDYTETSIPIVVNQQKHIDTTFTTSDLTLKVEQFQSRVIRPKMVQLAAQIDFDGLTNAKNTAQALVGTAGTTPNATSFILAAGQKLDETATERDNERYLVIDPAANNGLIGSMTGFFNDPRSIASQFKDAVFADLSNTLGFKIGMSQNVNKHTTGPLGGSPAVNGAAQGLTTGYSNTGTLVTNGWTAAAALRVRAGDVFTVPTVNAVNPLTRQSTGSLQQFTVIADGSSDGSGNLTLQITPAIITAGAFQNVTNSPVNGNALTFVGSAGVLYPRNMAWHPDAFTLACVPMEDVSEFGAWGAVKTYEDFSMRVARQYAISTDTVPTRCDVLYGWATPYGEKACQLTG